MYTARAISPIIIALTLLAFAAEAVAESDEEILDKRPRHRTSEVLFHMDVPRVEGKNWIESHMALRKGIGIVYRHQLTTEDDHKLILSVGGPVLKKKRFGMMFEVRF